MKVIVAGSREIDDYRVVRDAVAASPFAGQISEIVCGAARGVDKFGLAYAIINNLPWVEFPADWQQHGNSAGFRRNAQMANYADALVAIRLNRSKGTTHMIAAMQERGKPYYVVDIEDTGDGRRVTIWPAPDDPE